MSPFPVRGRIRSNRFAACSKASPRTAPERAVARQRIFVCGGSSGALSFSFGTVPSAHAGERIRAGSVTGNTEDAQTALCSDAVQCRNRDTVSKHSSLLMSVQWRGRMELSAQREIRASVYETIGAEKCPTKKTVLYACTIHTVYSCAEC